MLDISATLHSRAPKGFPTPSSVLRGLTGDYERPHEYDLVPSALASVANALVVPPIHVDHVAEAICSVILDETVEGVVDVSRMRELIGWSTKGGDATCSTS